MAGQGKVAINAPGPVETVEVSDGELRVQGRLVLGRTDGLQFSSQRSAPFPRNLISGQRRLRVYSGTGKALVCWTPYWNEHMYQLMTGDEHRGIALRVTAGIDPARRGGRIWRRLADGARRWRQALHRGRSRAGGRPARFARPAAVDRGAARSTRCRRRWRRSTRRWRAGRWIAGYAAYELGYAFEPRLAPLMPAERRLPLLEFGVFEAPGAGGAGGAGRGARAVPAGLGLRAPIARPSSGWPSTSAPATSTRRT